MSGLKEAKEDQQLVEKVFSSVIPSRARDLLFAKYQEKKQIPRSGIAGARNDRWEGFSASCWGVKERIQFGDLTPH
jgi:hypothetical protein